MGVAGTEEIKVERKSESPRIDFGEAVEEDWAEERAKQWPMHGPPSAPQVVAGKPQAVLQDFVQLQTRSQRVRARAGEAISVPKIARNMIVRTGNQTRFGLMSKLLWSCVTDIPPRIQRVAEFASI